MDNEQLKFPIGKRIPVESPSPSLVQEWMANIENFPNRLERLVQNATMEQLNYRYRPDGWTVKQVVHHCVDSHLNGIVKFKLALTEDAPTIKTYKQADWAVTEDAMDNDLSYSLQLLQALHAKWLVLLRSLTPEQMKRGYIHPDHGRLFTVEESIQIYSWHCRHHHAHIKNALASEGKYN